MILVGRPLPDAVARARSTKAARSTLPLVDPKRGRILDELAIWLVQAQDELTKYKRSQKVSVCSLFNNTLSITGSRENATEQSVFEAKMVFGKDALPSDRSLLRGVAFEFFGKYDRPITVNVLPPKGAVTLNGQAEESAPVFFGRVCPFSSAIDLKPQQADIFWNGSPIGEWKIQGIFDRKFGTIDGVAMHIWVATPSEASKG